MRVGRLPRFGRQRRRAGGQYDPRNVGPGRVVLRLVRHIGHRRDGRHFLRRHLGFVARTVLVRQRRMAFGIDAFDNVGMRHAAGNRQQAGEGYSADETMAVHDVLLVDAAIVRASATFLCASPHAAKIPAPPRSQHAGAFSLRACPNRASFAIVLSHPLALPHPVHTMNTPRIFGTPLSPSATKVMLLGSGELGKEVIISLQRLGVEVIAVDRYPNAPGHQVAHRSHVIDMTDRAALRALVEQERPHLIVPEIEAIATDALAAIETDGLAEVIPTARATQLTMNREGIRRLAAEELGLPTSPYAFADSLDELRAGIAKVGYPCVVKPVMSSSGKGQSVLKSDADVEPAWQHAMAGGRVNHGRVIVEGFIDFEYEITQLTVRAIDPASGEVSTYFCDPIGHVQVAGDYVESWQPQPMSPLALERSREVAHKVTAALGGRGLFGVELFVRGDDVWFSEVSPRPHDTGLVTLATQRFSEFDLHARAILGLPVDTTLRAPGASAVIYGGLDVVGVAFEGVADALAVPDSDLRLFGKPESFAKRRMGVALATGRDTDEARERAKLAASKVRPVSAR